MTNTKIIAWNYNCLEREIMIFAGPCDCLRVGDGAMDLNSSNGCHLSLGELNNISWHVIDGQSMDVSIQSTYHWIYGPLWVWSIEGSKERISILQLSNFLGATLDGGSGGRLLPLHPLPHQFPDQLLHQLLGEQNIVSSFRLFFLYQLHQSF